MKRIILPILITASLLLAACGGSSSPTANTPQGTSAVNPAGKYIVVFKPGESITTANNVAAGLANRPAHSYQHALVGFAATLSANEHARLLNDPRVDYIEPDLPVSIAKGKPPGTPGGGGGDDGGDDTGQATPWGVARIEADLNTNTGSGIGVAVLDTGVDLDHPDLANVMDGANFIRSSKPADDDNGHGTHVAGTIAAADNTFGVVGVAPGATIYAVKVLDRRGNGTLGGVIAGIEWCMQNATDVQVANMSLRAIGFSPTMYTAIGNATAAGVTFVAAAGNDSIHASNVSPGGFDNVISVSALNPNETFASYSNYGNPPVDLIAPGTNVESLWKGGGYRTISGTSMACPHVAGAAALFCASNPGAAFGAVHAGLIAAAESGTWAGDPELPYEPLVDAGSL